MSKERGVWESSRHVCDVTPDAILRGQPGHPARATIQYRTEGATKPDSTTKSLHAPSLETEEQSTSDANSATPWPRFWIFPCLNFLLCKMQLQGVQDNKCLFNARHRTLEEKKECFPSMPGNVPRLGWIPWERGAVTWLLHKQTAARDAGWGIAWVRLSHFTPFPLNVGSKAPLLLFLEKQESSLLFGVSSCRHKHIDFLGLFNCGSNSKLCQQWPY